MLAGVQGTGRLSFQAAGGGVPKQLTIHSDLESDPFLPLPRHLLTFVQLRQGEEILVISFQAEDVGQQNLPEPRSDRMVLKTLGSLGHWAPSLMAVSRSSVCQPIRGLGWGQEACPQLNRKFYFQPGPKLALFPKASYSTSLFPPI